MRCVVRSSGAPCLPKVSYRSYCPSPNSCNSGCTTTVPRYSGGSSSPHPLPLDEAPSTAGSEAGCGGFTADHFNSTVQCCPLHQMAWMSGERGALSFMRNRTEDLTETCRQQAVTRVTEKTLRVVKTGPHGLYANSCTPPITMNRFWRFLRQPRLNVNHSLSNDRRPSTHLENHMATMIY